MHLELTLSVGFLTMTTLTTSLTAQRARARDLGVKPGVFAPGKLNAITDVAGVEVGYSTIVAMALLIALVLTDVLLCFMPGNSGQNRYGPGLHSRESVITDVF